MNFGQALEALKAGKRVARNGWNGKGMWLVLVRPDRTMSASTPSYVVTGMVADDGTPLEPLHWIGMKTADDCFVPWLASQTDLLAEDWIEVT